MKQGLIPQNRRVSRITPRTAIWLGAILCFTVAGCGPQRAKAVDVDLARVTLTKMLEHWKQGGTIEELRQEKPEIVAQEPLWTNGNKLLEFSLVDQGRAEDANWFCQVELTMQAPDSDKTVKKNVTYVVGTDPVLTVFHAIL